MLMRTDPFRDLDRLAQQLVGAGTSTRPSVMPLDAWREGDAFVLEFDLPGVQPETLDIDVERNVLTVRAERPPKNGDWEMLAAERPTGLFSRQLVLGDNLDLDRLEARYDYGAPVDRPRGRASQAAQDRGDHGWSAGDHRNRRPDANRGSRRSRGPSCCDEWRAGDQRGSLAGPGGRGGRLGPAGVRGDRRSRLGHRGSVRAADRPRQWPTPSAATQPSPVARPRALDARPAVLREAPMNARPRAGRAPPPGGTSPRDRSERLAITHRLGSEDFTAARTTHGHVGPVRCGAGWR